MSTVLLTGANGFIGRHVVPLLADVYETIYAVTHRPDQPADSNNVRWHTCDLLDPTATRSLLELTQPQALLHLAWDTTPGSYWTSDTNYQWVQASLALLAAFRDVGGRRVVGVGTMAEYDWDYGHCIAGKTPYRPATPYGAAKHALHLMQTQLAAQHGLSSAWAHIFFGYGPYERPQRVVPYVVNRLLRGKVAETSHGQQVRDFMYAADVAAALVALAQSELEGAFNVASGAPLRLRDLLSEVAVLLDAPDLLHFGARPTAPQDPPVLTADVRRLRDELGWEPQTTLTVGLQQTIKWWREHPAPNV